MDVASTSSRSFRERVLTASILSVFRNGQREPTIAENSHSRSTSSTETTCVKIEQPDTPGLQDKDDGIQPVNTNNTSNISDRQQTDDGYISRIGTDEKNILPKAYDDLLASHNEGDINYKSMVWWQAGMLMVAETISLGILSLPMSLSHLGIIPGLILLIFLGVMASYSGYVIGQFRLAHPHILSMADAGGVLFGRVGGEIVGAGQLLFFIFIMGSHILTFAVMMNAVTDHGACTIIFMAAGTILSFIFTLPRTLKNVSYYSIVSFISIISAVVVTMVGVGIARPGFHLDKITGQTVQEFRLWPAPDLSFHKAFLAVANMVFAYAGHVAFFNFIAELKDPREFPKALALLQVSDISMYVVTAVVVYYYSGNQTTSPALDSAGPIIRKIAYGVAIPTIIIAGVVNGHVAVKYMYVRILRNNTEDLMHKTTFKAVAYWVIICALFWFIAWLIAEAVPVFEDLLGLTSALFASWFTFGFSGMFWISLNFRRGPKWWQVVPRTKWNWRKTVALIANLVNLVLGLAICVIGLYASGVSIAYNSQKQKPFSCADTSRYRS